MLTTDGKISRFLLRTSHGNINVTTGVDVFDGEEYYTEDITDPDFIRDYSFDSFDRQVYRMNDKRWDLDELSELTPFRLERHEFTMDMFMSSPKLIPYQEFAFNGNEYVFDEFPDSDNTSNVFNVYTGEYVRAKLYRGYSIFHGIHTEGNAAIEIIYDTLRWGVYSFYVYEGDIVNSSVSGTMINTGREKLWYPPVTNNTGTHYYPNKQQRLPVTTFNFMYLRTRPDEYEDGYIYPHRGYGGSELIDGEINYDNSYFYIEYFQLPRISDKINIEGEKEMIQPRPNTYGVGVYVLDTPNMQNLFLNLWHTEWDEKMNAFYGKTSDAILSLNFYYGINRFLNMDYAKKLVIGNQIMQDFEYIGDFMGADEIKTRAYLQSHEFIKFKLLPVTIPHTHYNFLDYAPYTQVDIYIPFYGYHQIDPSYCMGGQVEIEYSISLTTGAAVALVRVMNSGFEAPILIDSLPCNMSVDIPINAVGFESLQTRRSATMRSLAPSVIGAVAGGMAGSLIGMPTAGSVMGAKVAQTADSYIKGGDTQGIQHQTNQTTRVGGLGSEFSVLSPLELTSLIKSPIVASEDASKYIGKPAYKVKKLGSYTDGQFVKVGAIGPDSTNGEHKYGDDIARLIMGGIFI